MRASHLIYWLSLMNSHARVLIVSRDEMLLRTREMILGAFFQVERAGRFIEAKALLNRDKRPTLQKHEKTWKEEKRRYDENLPRIVF